MKKKFEYKIAKKATRLGSLVNDEMEFLNNMGEHGWELLFIKQNIIVNLPYKFYFKREITEPPQEEGK